MSPSGARRRLLGVALLALAPLLLSGALWISQDHRGFLTVAFALAAAVFIGYLALRCLPGVLARAAESAEGARRELEHARHEVRTAVEAVHRAARDLERANRSLSERSEAQARAIEQATASIEELGASVNSNTETACETQRVATLAGEATSDGILAATRVIARMESVREATGEVAQIVGLIDAVAFQTNILALNAAVEAARAGDQGRGFAVVAAEVRALSLRCADSAHQIRDLVRSTANQVGESADVVEQAAESMAAINGRVAEVKELMNAIVTAGAEQSTGIGQVGQTIAHMEQATRQNAALVGEIVSATELLTAQTSRLAELVEGFSRPVPASVAPDSRPSAEARSLIARHRVTGAK